MHRDATTWPQIRNPSYIINDATISSLSPPCDLVIQTSITIFIPKSFMSMRICKTFKKTYCVATLRYFYVLNSDIQVMLIITDIANCS